MAKLMRSPCADCIPRLELFDTFGFTNTYAARKDGNDAVHYGHNTTVMESQTLLNMLCQAKPLRGSPAAPLAKCSEGQGYNARLTAMNGETKAACIPDGWHASHSRR